MKSKKSALCLLSLLILTPAIAHAADAPRSDTVVESVSNDLLSYLKNRREGTATVQTPAQNTATENVTSMQEPADEPVEAEDLAPVTEARSAPSSPAPIFKPDAPSVSSASDSSITVFPLEEAAAGLQKLQPSASADSSGGSYSPTPDITVFPLDGDLPPSRSAEALQPVHLRMPTSSSNTIEPAPVMYAAPVTQAIEPIEPAPVVAEKNIPAGYQAPVAAEPVETASPRVFTPKHLAMTTTPGFELGVSGSHYKYREEVANVHFMDLKGGKVGIEGSYTYPLEDYAYLRGELKLSYGSLDYNGSGRASGVEDYMTEYRALIGKDFAFNNYGVSFYGGYGGRELYNDLSGFTSTGASGYKRRSHYDYIPLGMTNRVRISDGSRLSLNTEYDYFVHGTQKSSLGPTLDNDQGSAYVAARGSALYETKAWSVGPWIDYWHIKDSDINCTVSTCGMEPRNATTEFGLKVLHRFN